MTHWLPVRTLPPGATPSRSSLSSSPRPPIAGRSLGDISNEVRRGHYHRGSTRNLWLKEVGNPEERVTKALEGLYVVKLAGYAGRNRAASYRATGPTALIPTPLIPALVDTPPLPGGRVPAQKSARSCRRRCASAHPRRAPPAF